MAWMVEFLVFAFLAAGAFYLGWTATDKNRAFTAYTGSAILWITTGVQWLSDHTGLTSALALVFGGLMLVSFFYAFQNSIMDLGE